MYCPTTKELGRRWRQSIVRAAGAAEKSKPELSPIHLTFSSSWSQSSKKIRLRIARFDVASGVRERLTNIYDLLYLCGCLLWPCECRFHLCTRAEMSTMEFCLLAERRLDWKGQRQTDPSAHRHSRIQHPMTEPIRHPFTPPSDPTFKA